MRRGSFFDMFYLVLILFSLFIIAPLAMQLLGAVGTAMSANPQTAVGGAMATSVNTNQLIPGADAAFIVITMAIGIIAIMAVTPLLTSPLGLFIGIFVMGLVTYFSMIISNAAQEVYAANPTAYASFPYTYLIMVNLPIVVTLLMILMIIVFLIKRRNSEYVEA